MITLHDWLVHFRKQPSTAPTTQRKARLDPLEERRLLTIIEPVDTLDATEGTSDELQPFVFVLSSSAADPVLESPTGNEPMGPLALEEGGSGEGYAWVQGSGSGSGYVPGSVLASSGPLDWESTSDTFSPTDSAGEGVDSFNSSGSASGSGGASASGFGSAWGSGSGGSSGSGYGDSSGSGWGSSSEGSASGGYGSASGSGYVDSSGSGFGFPAGSSSGSSSGSGSGENAPPVIHDFAWRFENGSYIFTGYVTDDQDPAGLTVNFGGLLTDTCVVSANGSFQFMTTIGDPLGEVTSQVQDRDLAWSEIETVII